MGQREPCCLAIREGVEQLHAQKLGILSYINASQSQLSQVAEIDFIFAAARAIVPDVRILHTRRTCTEVLPTITCMGRAARYRDSSGLIRVQPLV